ncbi:caspase family protein [Leptolyngbya sp. AN02str]|uniref:caspase family protein n=1 Tax=Leptolyngbya sp. AN02str TaxID=3423363 RepID=UPI003D316965
MELTRRQFLQRMGWAIATLGISQGSFFALADRYHAALADSTSRKLALLVGINQYPESVSDFTVAKNSALKGSLNDVDMQRELLVHRFGFQPSDIALLTGEQATRMGIETGFQQHLVEQARLGDAAVFHFSGLGSRVKLVEGGAYLRTLVPIDGVMPNDEQPILNDIQEDTLQLLVRSLATSNVTLVLDAGCSNLGSSLLGNFRVRSRPNIPSGKPHPAELAMQDQLAARLPQGRSRTGTVLPGAWLWAAGVDRPALEAQWSSFSAGLLTYTLTQYLWQETAGKSLQVIFPSLVERVQYLTTGRQQPMLAIAAKGKEPSAYTSTPDAIAADGVVTGVDSDGSLQLWMGGLSALALESYSPPAGLTLIPHNLPLQVRSKDGLRIRASLPTEIELDPVTLIGQPVQERMRFVPRTAGLTVALDNRLERIERVDATSAFSAVKVATVSVGEQSADFLFGKPRIQAQTLTASLADATIEPLLPPPAEKIPDRAGFGLFYPSRRAVPGTLVKTEEAVKAAVTRLTPMLRSLQALKLLRLTCNTSTSKLQIRVGLETVGANAKLLAQQETIRTLSQDRKAGSQMTMADRIVSLPKETATHFRVQNFGDRLVHVLLVNLSTTGSTISLHPLHYQPNPQAIAQLAIAPGEVLLAPLTAQPIELAETFLFFNHAPFAQTGAIALPQTPSTSAGSDLDLAQAILQDLQAASPEAELTSSPDFAALDVHHWATFNFLYTLEPV